MSDVLVCTMCGSEYAAWASRCSSCGVALVPKDDSLNPLDLPEDEQVVYELAEWSLGQRTALEAELAEQAIPHAWEGTDLIVGVDSEERVDEICERVEAGELGDEDDRASLGQVLYELDEWSPDERVALGRTLTDAGIAYAWEDETTLVVRTDDEASVESLLDRIEYPNELPIEDDVPMSTKRRATSAAAEGDDDAGDGTGDDGSEDDGADDKAGDEDDEDEVEVLEPASAELMGELFLAADRLQHDPSDAGGISGIADHVEDLDDYGPPWGMDPEPWAKAVSLANDIADVLADENGDPDVVQERSKELRTLLRPFV